MTTHLCAGSSRSGRRGHPPPWSSRSCRTFDCRRKSCLHPAPSGRTVGIRSAWTGCLRPLAGTLTHRFSQHHPALSRYQMEQAWTSCRWSFNLCSSTYRRNQSREAQSHACQKLSQKGRAGQSWAQGSPGCSGCLHGPSHPCSVSVFLEDTRTVCWPRPLTPRSCEQHGPGQGRVTLVL